MKILIELFVTGRIDYESGYRNSRSSAREQSAADMSVSPAYKPKDRKKNDLEEQPLAN